LLLYGELSVLFAAGEALTHLQNCGSVVAEYALCNINQPIGVAEYQLTESLPTHLQSSLPSIEAIEQALADPTAGAPMP
jgi:hypothetical protein